MAMIAEIKKRADKPIEGNDMAEQLRGLLLIALEGWEKEKEDRVGNLQRLLPELPLDGKQALRESVRSTIRSLTQDLREFKMDRSR